MKYNNRECDNMRKYKVIVFGNLPIATKVVMELQNEKNIELVGAVISDKNPNNNDPWREIPCMYEFCSENGIEVIELEKLPERFKKQELDLGLSCRFGKIISSETIQLFSKGIVNMHGGLLPEFAGLYSCNFSVLYGSKKGGGTLHYIDEGIDTGNILRRCEFDIDENDTGYTVFQKTQKALFKNMMEIIPLVLEGKIEAYPMQELIEKGYESRYFNKSSIYSYKEIKAEMSEEEILRTVRAFDFPGYEPAYMMVNGKKIYLRMS